MRKLGKRLALLLLTACMAAGEAPMAVWAETTEAAEEIPPVHEMDDDNEYVRIVIGKTPEVTIGKSDTISVQVMNMEDKDWVEAEIWIAPESDFKGH